MKSEKITVLIVDPYLGMSVKEIDNELETLQSIVGGWIEVVRPPSHGNDNVDIICNEEGKLLEMKPNRYLRDENGKPYDVVCGTFIVAGADDESGEFISLTENQLFLYANMYAI